MPEEKALRSSLICLVMMIAMPWAFSQPDAEKIGWAGQGFKFGQQPPGPNNGDLLDVRNIWTRDFQKSLTLSPSDWSKLVNQSLTGTYYALSAQMRGFYRNDQRFQFTGMEASAGVEASLAGLVAVERNGWLFAFETEIQLNQPYDDNKLADNPERASYADNFGDDAFEISQLLLSARRGDVLLGFGKMVTPFGRTYFPLYSNNRRDAPFIRTESILWHETGILAQYDPGIWVISAAAVNGSEDMDTNSSKGGVFRAGVDLSWLSAGSSFKIQDGIGSEMQKMYNNHIGIDAMVRWQRFTLSGEAIYDEYGFHQPGFDPNDITWRRGLYYREQNLAQKEAIHGFGYYLNLGYSGERWAWLLNYGEFYPQQIGDPLHDVTTRRGVGKVKYRVMDLFDVFAVCMIENNVEQAQMGQDRQGLYVLYGVQAGF
jgi:hypothetical protein